MCSRMAKSTETIVATLPPACSDVMVTTRTRAQVHVPMNLAYLIHRGYRITAVDATDFQFQDPIPFPPTLVSTASFSWFCRALLIEIIDDFICIVNIRSRIPLPILVITLPCHSKEHLFFSPSSPFCIENIIYLPLLLIVYYDRRLRLVVLTRQWVCLCFS